MTVSRQLKQFLDGAGVSYKVTKHPEAFTAQEVAAVEHVPGKAMAKVVVVMADKKPVMAVLPASYRVNFDKLKALLGAKAVRLASEDEFGGLFQDCEVGAMPPFGELFDLPVYSDQVLSEDERITFNAGTHTETVTLAYADFERLANPTVGDFAEHV